MQEDAIRLCGHNKRYIHYSDLKQIWLHLWLVWSYLWCFQLHVHVECLSQFYVNIHVKWNLSRSKSWKGLSYWPTCTHILCSIISMQANFFYFSARHETFRWCLVSVHCKSAFYGTINYFCKQETVIKELEDFVIIVIM